MAGTDLNSVIKLFLQQQNEEKLHERHIAAIQSVCKHNSAGFALRDLPAVSQILQVIMQLIDKGVTHFVEPACLLVRTLAKPYSKRSTSDELKLQPIITGLLNTLEAVLQPGIPQQLQECTAELLAEFSSAYNNRPDVFEMSQEAAAAADLQSALRLYRTHQSLLYQSNIAPAVIALLQAEITAAPSQNSCSNHPASNSRSRNNSRPVSSSHAATGTPSSLISALVEMLLNFSYSAELSEQLLQHELLPTLVHLMHAYAGTDSSQAVKLIGRIIEMLWNLVELAPAAAQQALSPNQRAMHKGLTTQQQIQLTEQQHCLPCSSADEPPWPVDTDPESPSAADIWVRQSACPSCDTTRPATRAPSAHAAEGSAPNAATSAPAAAADHQLQQAAYAGVVGSPGSAAACTDETAVGARIGTPCGGTAAGLVEALAALFKQQLQNTSSKQAKEQRNDTLAVLQHLSSVPCCCAAFATSSFTAVALAAATTPELQPSSQHVPAGALTKEPEDLEMKLLLWGVLGNITTGSSVCLTAVAPGLLQTLLLVVDESAGHSCFAVGRWNPEQVVALRKMAWSVLQQVAPLCKAEFRSCGGAKLLTRHVSSCYNSNCSAEWVPRSCSSPGNRSHSVASIAANSALQASFVSGGGSSFLGRQSSTSIEPAMRLLQRLVTGDSTMAEALADQGLVAALLELLQAPVCIDAAGTRQGVLLVLAELCAAGGSSCRSKVRQAGGVGLLLKECNEVVELDPSQPSLACLAALDAMWRCVLPSASARAQLLALGGMDTLLELLLQGNTFLRPVVLSALADLLADKRAHPFFLDWHAPAPIASVSAAVAGGSAIHSSSVTGTGISCNTGTASISATQLLIRIWREQDQARGLSGPDGVLTNPSRPLAGTGARTKWAVDDTGVSGGYGVLQPQRKAALQRIAAASNPDLMLDKVYACLAQLGFDSLSSTLDPSDAAVLCFIRQYVKFRQGEVWQGIAAEFEAAGITPTQEDGLRVASGIQHSELIAAQLQQEQAALLASVRARELAAEQAEYNAMLAQAAADAKSKVWGKDASKLTMRERLAARARKEEMLKHSIASSISAAIAAVPGTIPAYAGIGGEQDDSTV